MIYRKKEQIGRVLSKGNEGVGSTRNFGVKNAVGMIGTKISSHRKCMWRYVMRMPIGFVVKRRKKDGKR